MVGQASRLGPFFCQFGKAVGINIDSVIVNCDRKHEERDTRMDFLPAKDAKNAIKKMLLGNGGAAQVAVGNKRRLLIHDESERPLYTLPWPLKLFQAHSFRYLVYEERTAIEERNFTRRQINDAISLFLDGVPPDEEIVLNPD